MHDMNFIHLYLFVLDFILKKKKKKIKIKINQTHKIFILRGFSAKNILL